MGEALDRKNRKAILVVLVISLFALSMSQIPNNSASQGSQPSQSTGLLQNGQLDQSAGIQSTSAQGSDPTGPPRPVSEYALGTRAGQSVNLPSSPNVYVDLGSGWVGNSATFNVTGLWDSQNQAVNGTFDYGSGTSSPPWSFSKYDISYPHSTFTGSWYNNLPQTGNTTVRCQMPLPSGSITFGGNERVSWNETVLPLRGTVISARLIFNWYPVVATGFTRSEFIFYSTVNNTRLEGVGTPFPWQYNLKDVASNPSVDNHWNLANFTIPASAFNLPSKRISIEIGIMYTSGYATYSGWNSLNYMYIDNVRLVLQALAKPHQVNLKVRPQGYSNVTVSDGSGYGSGTTKVTGFTTSGTSFPFIFSGGNLTSPNTAGLTCAVKVNATRQTTATSTFQTSSSGQKIAWTFRYQTYFPNDGQPVGAGPTYYTKYYFNISMPSDYDTSTSNCTDPSGVFHNVNAEANFTKFIVGSDAILRVNVTRIGSYTGPTNPPPNGPYAPYLISALSVNYVKNVWTQLWNSTQWENATSFYPLNNRTRFASYIASGGTSVSGGNATLTISGPPTYNASPIDLYTRTNVPAVNGFANFTIWMWNTTNYAAGRYSGRVDWVNTTIGEGGSLTCYFNLNHTLTPVITVPAAGDLLGPGQVLADPPATVKIYDFYTNEVLTGNVTGCVQWDTARKWSKFTFSPSQIAYTNVTHVWSTVSIGNAYWFNVSATKPFYDRGNASNSYYIATATYIEYDFQTVVICYTENQSFKVTLPEIAYKYGSGSLITSATFTLLGDSSSNNSLIQWNTRFHENRSKVNQGKYFGTIDVGTFSPSRKAIPPGGETYLILFRLYNGTYCQTQYFTFKLTVEQPSSYLEVVGAVEKPPVFWGDVVEVKLNYWTEWSRSGSGYSYSLNNPILNYSTQFPYDSSVRFAYNNWTTGFWNANHSLGDDDGVYSLYLNTAAWPSPDVTGYGSGTVHVRVRLTKTYYSFSNYVTVTLHIKTLTTCQSVFPTNTTTTATYSRDTKTILVWYNDTHIPGAPRGIGGANVTYTSSGGNILGWGPLTAVAGRPGLYNLTLTGGIGGRTDQLPGTYTLYVHGQKDSEHVGPHTITITLNINPIDSTLQAYYPVSSIYYLDRLEYMIWFNDTHNGVPISGATVSWTAPGLAIYPGGEFPGCPGLYNLTVPSGQAVGHYTITINASKTRYASSYTVLTLDIIRLPTAITSYVIVDGSILVQTNASAQQGTSLTIYLWFNDTRNYVGIVVPAHSFAYSSSEFGSAWASPVTDYPGLYYVTLQTPHTGNFTLDFTVSVSGYDPQSLTFTVNVYRLPTALVSHIISGGAILVRSNVTIPQGGNVTIYLWFNDTHNLVPVAGVEQSIKFDSSYTGFGHGYVYPVLGVPGLYYVTFTGDEAGVFTVTFVANVTGYQVQSLTFTVTVQAPALPPPGFSTVQLMIVGFGGGGIVIVAVAAWVLMKRARIPFIIKKINESLKLIGKGEHERATPVPLKSREESIVGIVQERIDAFSKRKAAPGAPPEAVPAEKAAEAAAAAAPPAAAEVEAALKKELKAVEPGKPEEEIEEVEMETLDEELGRLEKIDTGQEVPEGAKQARDVIDEYKKRKKKR